MNDLPVNIIIFKLKDSIFGENLKYEKEELNLLGSLRDDMNVLKQKKEKIESKIDKLDKIETKIEKIESKIDKLDKIERFMNVLANNLNLKDF